MTTLYKVVGVQVVPKKQTHRTTISSYTSWKGIQNGKAIFEKLIPKSDQKRTLIRELNNRTFSVVGIMEFSKSRGHFDFKMDVAMEDSLDSGVMSRIHSMLRTVH